MRRVLNILAALAAVGILLALWGFGVEPRLLVLREFTVLTPKWPSSHRPLRVAFLADFHAGAPGAGLDAVERAVARANAAKPDIVLLGGDYVIQGVLGGEKIAPEPIAARLAALDAPLGVYAVLGNHDWWEDGGRIARVLGEAGIPVLENAAVRIERDGGAFWLVGVGDDMTDHDRAAQALAQVADDAPVVVLTHDPAIWPDVGDDPALTLAGHMHGGQVYLPGVGALITPGRAPRRWAWGHIRENGRDLYVTAGIGTSILPVRFGMPPEVAVLTLGAMPTPAEAF